MRDIIPDERQFILAFAGAQQHALVVAIQGNCGGTKQDHLGLFVHDFAQAKPSHIEQRMAGERLRSTRKEALKSSSDESHGEHCKFSTLMTLERCRGERGGAAASDEHGG